MRTQSFWTDQLQPQNEHGGSNDYSDGYVLRCLPYMGFGQDTLNSRADGCSGTKYVCQRARGNHVSLNKWTSGNRTVAEVVMTVDKLRGGKCGLYRRWW